LPLEDLSTYRLCRNSEIAILVGSVCDYPKMIPLKITIQRGSVVTRPEFGCLSGSILGRVGGIAGLVLVNQSEPEGRRKWVKVELSPQANKPPLALRRSFTLSSMALTSFSRCGPEIPYGRFSNPPDSYTSFRLLWSHLDYSFKYLRLHR
jgi:hypothetical protein